ASRATSGEEKRGREYRTLSMGQARRAPVDGSRRTPAGASCPRTAVLATDAGCPIGRPLTAAQALPRINAAAASLGYDEPMHVRGRPSTRHMKGRQVAMTLYLPPQKYWLLKSVS